MIHFSFVKNVPYRKHFLKMEIPKRMGPIWGRNEEIKLLSVHNRVLLKVSSFKPGVSQNIAGQSFTYCQDFWSLLSTFSLDSTSLVPWSVCAAFCLSFFYSVGYTKPAAVSTCQRGILLDDEVGMKSGNMLMILHHLHVATWGRTWKMYPSVDDKHYRLYERFRHKMSS